MLFVEELNYNPNIAVGVDMDLRTIKYVKAAATERYINSLTDLYFNLLLLTPLLTPNLR